ncbi:hypothetical protein [Bacillus pseudomycoides]|uniref:SH3b domain-containing protein n=1 Tax=Bacillus pseudomycoides TaxID=64104 RepID=A0A2A8BU22_9BACI|nr:hypothetical protein [Bacillus pseudomycoides]PDY44094.1 hypothetical protein CON79_27555 [Bacillus pseudomycoides]PEA82946.1 hypothetical protein CON99_14290 [Bacillus pseudomycoides]PED69493.1 hypothetical protein CON97_24840 [Bacillus pseudomycoides]PEI34034.1 hypothetical protein CN620_26755 [Bacillus pseudomycoides]PEJ72532.1 hypothetical protein CN680_21655 [Bacillus pseudomycoides]
MFKKVLLSFFFFATAGSILFSNQTVTHAELYPVQNTNGAGLDLRKTPTINGTRTERNIPDGYKLDLYCYVRGESYMGSTVWDWVGDTGYGGDIDNGFAPDYFIKTGSSSPVVPFCSW